MIITLDLPDNAIALSSTTMFKENDDSVTLHVSVTSLCDGEIIKIGQVQFKKYKTIAERNNEIDGKV